GSAVGGEGSAAAGGEDCAAGAGEASAASGVADGDGAGVAGVADSADGAVPAVPPIQGRLGFGVPKAASRFRRASSGGRGEDWARRTGSWCLPDRRRRRREAEEGSIMRYILDSRARIVSHLPVRTRCRSYDDPISVS